MLVATVNLGEQKENQSKEAKQSIWKSLEPARRKLHGELHAIYSSPLCLLASNLLNKVRNTSTLKFVVTRGEIDGLHQYQRLW